ncbi:hypothetical protein V1477_013373 [Vespula maculifrons]|uniref:Uncharacterized protein n=1 Tax=Vespula maculifrons TaxID=7453 RepID=A0ABD2BQR1_VESMC
MNQLKNKSTTLISVVSHGSIIFICSINNSNVETSVSVAQRLLRSIGESSSVKVLSNCRNFPTGFRKKIVSKMADHREDTLGSTATSLSVDSM